MQEEQTTIQDDPQIPEQPIPQPVVATAAPAQPATASTDVTVQFVPGPGVVGQWRNKQTGAPVSFRDGDGNNDHYWSPGRVMTVPATLAAILLAEPGFIVVPNQAPAAP